MQFAFRNEIEGSMVKSMLSRHGISRRLLTKVKFDGGKITVNGKDLDEFFGLETLKVIVRQPLTVTNTVDKYDVTYEKRYFGV